MILKHKASMMLMRLRFEVKLVNNFSGMSYFFERRHNESNIIPAEK